MELRKDFFYRITGIYENELNDEQNNNMITLYNNNYYIINYKNHIIYQAGKFATPNISYLREKTKNVKNKGSFSIRMGMNTSLKSKYRYKLDIGALQADKNNRGDTFQIASNFSVLEPCNITDLPKFGITKYINDKTQGPYGAISAAPGLIFRRYGLQTVNLLDDVAEYYPVTNGYIDLSKGYKIPNENITHKIKVGLHNNIQVTFGFTYDDRHEYINDNKQIIHQVLTSALDLGTSSGCSNYKLLQSDSSILLLSQYVLDAAYEGTILSAIFNKSKKCFLTLVGGGVFNNPLLSISKSILKLTDLIISSGLQIILIIYNYQSLSNDRDLFIKSLEPLVIQTKGSLEVYN